VSPSFPSFLNEIGVELGKMAARVGAQKADQVAVANGYNRPKAVIEILSN